MSLHPTTNWGEANAPVGPCARKAGTRAAAVLPSNARLMPRCLASVFFGPNDKISCMRVVLFFAMASALIAADTFTIFGHRWTTDRPQDWSVENGILRLLTSSEPPPEQPRRPTHYVLAETAYRKVTMKAEVKRGGRSLILVYAWQDASHYNYIHISSDMAIKQNVHNGVFHVFGGERVRISSLDGPASLPTQDWTPVKLEFDGDTGRCYVEVNGQHNPSLAAVDLSLRQGRVGIGSFDETGDVRNVRINGASTGPHY
jgi:hypothetical protein